MTNAVRSFGHAAEVTEPTTRGPLAAFAATEEAVYRESIRTLDEQAKVLDGLRSRAGALVAVSSLVTAFLGGQALTRSGTVVHVGGRAVTEIHLDAVAWTAISLFCLVLLLCLLIVAPWRNWVFTHHPHRLIAVHLDPGPPSSLPEFHRTLAYWNGTHYDANGKKLRILSSLFAAACTLLAFETVLWLWLLAGE
jgi:hypothetical protein